MQQIHTAHDYYTDYLLCDEGQLYLDAIFYLERGLRFLYGTAPEAEFTLSDAIAFDVGVAALVEKHALNGKFRFGDGGEPKPRETLPPVKMAKSVTEAWEACQAKAA